MTTTLWAVSDLHAAVKANRPRIETIKPADPSDWLIVAGDVAENLDLVLSILAMLKERFAEVIWVPGNHELYCRSSDRYVGRDRYAALVEGCRNLGVITPEDPYPLFYGTTIVPLFTLYDYTFRDPNTTIKDVLDRAEQVGLIMNDEITIAPFVDIRQWCRDRLAYSLKRLSHVEGPTILVNHWPLVREPTYKMVYQDAALWCGTRHTRDWPQRFHAESVVYGHLHMPGITTVDGIDHIEVSLGYPREWKRLGPRQWPYPVARGK